MTDKEKAIVMAHTGICMLSGNKFNIFHKYVEDIMGRPVFTHELGWLGDEIKEKSKADFMALCADESSSEKEYPEWLPQYKGEWKSEMRLLINIDEETYNDIKNGKIYTSFRDVPLEAVNAIANGTPLSAGCYETVMKALQIINKHESNKEDVK